MKYKQDGVLPGSEIYLHMPSEFAKSALFYVEECGACALSEDLFIQRPWFDMFEAFYIKKGNMEFRCLGRTYTAGPGDIALLDCKCTPHYFRSLTYSEEEWFHFNGYACEKDFEIFRETGQFVYSGEAFPAAVAGIHSVIEEARRTPVNEHRVSVGVATVLAELAAPGNALLQANDPAVLETVHYMEGHYAEGLTVAALAARVRLSQAHLIRRFKKATGSTPYEALLHIRIRQAKKLLLDATLPVEDVSAACGFNNVGSFIRAFKKTVQMTPLQYRKTPL